MTPLSAWLQPESPSAAILLWLVLALVHGTTLALITAILVRTLFRSAPASFHGALWLIALLKFILPIGPGWSYSLTNVTASMLDRWHSSRIAAAPPAADAAPNPKLLYVLSSDAPAAASSPSPNQPASTSTTNWLPILAYAYALAVILLITRRLLIHRKTVLAVRRLPLANPDHHSLVRSLCAQLRLRRVPSVRLSDEAPAPFILGFFRPTLVLSLQHTADPLELESVILHELAHLRRGDLLIRYVQWLTSSLLFFWPVVAWVNRKIDLAREHACDDWAVAHGRLSAADYARCLLRAVHPARSFGFRSPIAAMAANPKHVERRIEMILQAPTPASRTRSLGIGAAILLAAWAAFTLTGSASAVVDSVPAKKQITVQTLKADPIVLHDQGKDINVHVETTGDDQSLKVKITGAGEPKEITIPLSGVAERALSQIEAHDVQVFAVADALPGDFTSLVCNAGFTDFLKDHPTADADADGKISADEHDAFLVALAMRDPAATLAQFPDADADKNGALDATEAALLVTGGLMKFHHAIMAGGDAQPLHDVLQWHGVQPDPSGRAQAQFEWHAAGDGQKKIEIEAVPMPPSDPATANQPRTGVFMTKVHRKVVVNGETIEDTTTEGPTDAPAGEPTPFEIKLLGADGHDAAKWLLESGRGEPLASEVASFIPAVQEAPLIRFREIHPEADTDADGKVSSAERDAFMDKIMADTRAEILKQHPDADADNDGTLTQQEMDDFFMKDIAGKGAFLPDHPAGAAKMIMLHAAQGEPWGVKIESDDAQSENVQVIVKKIEVSKDSNDSDDDTDATNDEDDDD